ncbi:MAG: metallophosphoesterase family protein, partial [Clostridia bacterium]|nr:metallophosphoesterase family protein [Clostridia bacterium]
HIYNESHTPPLKRGDILLHGHTHVPVCSKYETYTYVNPGSVSIPKENTGNGYIIFENGAFTRKPL